MSNSGTLKVISLFAGAGGLEIAACSTGLVERIVSTDANPTFLETTRSNVPRHFPSVVHSAIVADALALTGEELISQLGGNPDIVMGGPPCDDFTHFGRRMGLVGDKGPLVFEFLRLVGETKPRCFIFENVPNLAQQFKGVLDRFIEGAEQLGYHVNWRLLTASDYGAATMRKRVVAVGWLSQDNQSHFKFPEQTHMQADSCVSGKMPHVLVNDVLAGLPDVCLTGHPDYFNHTGRKHKAATVEHMMTVPQGVHIKKSYRYRAPWAGLCRSLTAGVDHSTKSYIHPVYHREMSVREYARIHGFPDSWLFNGTHHNGIKQVANAVPVPLGVAIFRQVANTLNAKCGKADPND
jgi:DNA (cytosine-5)-methyltransferase 1